MLFINAAKRISQFDFINILFTILKVSPLSLISSIIRIRLLSSIELINKENLFPESAFSDLTSIILCGFLK